MKKTPKGLMNLRCGWCGEMNTGLKKTFKRFRCGSCNELNAVNWYPAAKPEVNLKPMTRKYGTQS